MHKPTVEIIRAKGVMMMITTVDIMLIANVVYAGCRAGEPGLQ